MEAKTYRKFTQNTWIPNSIKRILKNNSITPAYSTNNKIINKLSNTRKTESILQKSGVYSIKCTDCDSIYVGETGRSLGVRYNEHIKDRNSKVFRHITINGHNMPKENIRLEKPMNKCQAITIYENMIIDKKKENDALQCLNSQTEINYVPIYKFLKSHLIPVLETAELSQQ